MKICPKCKTAKDFSEFYSRKSSKDGLDYWCKCCAKLSVYSSPNSSKNCANYRKKHKDKFNAYMKSYYSNRRKKDPVFRIKENLRNRVRIALLNNFKSGSVISDLGCSIDDFRAYLESKFEKGMNWSNYGMGRYKWSMDHIVPLSHFELDKREQFLRACHYTNLQPMWWYDNIKKSNKT